MFSNYVIEIEVQWYMQNNCFPYCPVITGLHTAQYKYVADPRVNNIGHAVNTLELFYIRDVYIGSNKCSNKQDISRPSQVYV